MATSKNRLQVLQERYDSKIKGLVGEGEAVEVMVEAMSHVVQDLLRFEDEGWAKLGGLLEENRKGLSLDDVKKSTAYLEQQTKVLGGLLGRALRLKNNHLFGRGFRFETIENDAEIAPRFQTIIDDHDNWSTLFSPTALKELNRILFTSGNLFIMYDRKDKVFTRLSVDTDMANAITYSGDKSKIKYILRQYDDVDDLSGKTTPVKEWIPTLSWTDRLKRRKEKLPKTLPTGSGDTNDRAPVRQDAVIIEKRVNKDNGDTWGVPDSFSAAPWAVIYSSYLKDGAKLQNALAAISYLVKAKSEVAAKSAGAKLGGARVGQAAVTGVDTEITAMPKAGAIDLYEGRPLQAQVAANLDVSTTGIASDPGLGGSYASENALSQPEQLAALSRQEDFVDIFRQVFEAMGAGDKLTINFARLDSDPIHRTIQSLTMARETGGITQREYRDTVVEILDVIPVDSGLPKPDAWTGSKVSTLEKYIKDPDDQDPDPDNRGDDDGTATPAQGKSGAVGSLDDNGNDARNSDRDASTA